MAEDWKLEYFMGSVKLMLIVYGLAAFISMAVAWIIKLVDAGIRRQSASGEPAAKETAATPGKGS